MTTIQRVLFRTSLGFLVASLAAMAVDVGFGWHLPQPFRGALPLVLAASAILALTLGVGAYGMPKRPTLEGSADAEATTVPASQATEPGA